MAHRYSNREKACIWALRCQGFQPIEIRRHLAGEKSPLGYPLEISKSSMRDILRRQEAKHGPPLPTIARDEVDGALEAIELEAVGAIRRTVRELTTKNPANPLTRNEVSTLAAAVQATEGLRRRRRVRAAKRAKQGDSAKEGEQAGESVLMRRLASKLDAESATNKGAEQSEASEAEASEAAEIRPSDGASSLAPVRA